MPGRESIVNSNNKNDKKITIKVSEKGLTFFNIGDKKVLCE